MVTRYMTEIRRKWAICTIKDIFGHIHLYIIVIFLIFLLMCSKAHFQWYGTAFMTLLIFGNHGNHLYTKFIYNTIENTKYCNYSTTVPITTKFYFHLSLVHTYVVYKFGGVALLNRDFGGGGPHGPPPLLPADGGHFVFILLLGTAQPKIFFPKNDWKTFMSSYTKIYCSTLVRLRCRIEKL